VILPKGGGKLSRNLVETIINIDSDEINSIVRMLILIDTFAGKNSNGKIEGITKLAILDFLLKYPVALDRTLEKQKTLGNKAINKKGFELESYEVNSIDAKMMRFNFAPWDFKYRRIVSILKAKGLISVDLEGNKVALQITSNGIDMAKEIRSLNNYKYLIKRCKIIKTVFGNWSKKKLIDMIYITFPEILTLKVGMCSYEIDIFNNKMS
jgi:hypothetical protein